MRIIGATNGPFAATPFFTACPSGIVGKLKQTLEGSASFAGAAVSLGKPHIAASWL